MKPTLIILTILLCSFTSFAQVGIGNTNPNTDALLEIGNATTTTKGLLLPRVNLANTTIPSPLSTDISGMIVYNKATTGDVTPGFYYNDGALWVRLGAGTPSDDWTTTGNAGTTAGTNFVGTTDAIDVVLATNGSENMRLINGGQVAVNETTPFAGDRFTVTGASNEYTINGYASGSAGVAIYAESSGFDAIVGSGSRFGVLGFGTYALYGSGSSRGVYGVVDNASGFGMVANNINATGVGILASGANAPLSYLASTGGTFNGTTAVAGFSTSATGTGVSGIGNNGVTSTTLSAGSGVAGVGDTGVYGISDGTNGTGIIGVGGDVGGDTSSITTNNTGSGISGSGLTMGVFGYAGNGDDVAANYGNAGGEFILDGDNDPTTNGNNNESNRARAILAGFNDVTPDGSASSEESYFGGYFSGGNENGTPSYAYAGMRYNINNNGTSGTDYKIIGTGTNSTLINDSNGNPRILFSPEAPEILFQDFGVGQLVNGQARISIDPLLKGSLHIDNEHPLKVYVTLEGDCKGVYVTNKTSDGFTVKELQGGTSDAAFSWQIVASRADTKDSSGRLVSKHVGVRLPIGPGPIGSELKKLEKKEEDAKVVKDDSKDVIIKKKVKNKPEVSENKN